MALDRLWENRSEKIVILDSSAIMMLFEFSVNLEDELTKLVGKYKILIPSAVYAELELLSKKGKGKKKINAKASLKLIERYEIFQSDGKNADDSIFLLAKKTKGIVVTNDRELKRRIKKISLPVIYLRAKKKLVLE